MKTPKTFKELFANTGIEPTTDESGKTHYSFKVTIKEKAKQETLEEASSTVDKIDGIIFDLSIADKVKLFDLIETYVKEEQERSYSEEEDIKFSLKENPSRFNYGYESMQYNLYSEKEVEDIMAETWIQCVSNDGNDFKVAKDKILQQFKKK
jgi:hypothetical protein